MFLPKMFLHIFNTRCSKYRRVLVNAEQNKFDAHTDFEKLEGTLVIMISLHRRRGAIWT